MLFGHIGYRKDFYSYSGKEEKKSHEDCFKKSYYFCTLNCEICQKGKRWSSILITDH